MKKIELTHGYIALVDDEDFDMLSKFKWRAYQNPHYQHLIYAITTTSKRKTLRMHRHILGAKKGEIVDHQNHNTLDNRRANLRIVTALENSRNVKLRSDNTSGVCGVHFHKTSKKWVARFTRRDGSILFVEYFEKIEDAIKARKNAERKFNFHENHGKRIDEILVS